MARRGFDFESLEITTGIITELDGPGLLGKPQRGGDGVVPCKTYNETIIINSTSTGGRWRGTASAKTNSPEYTRSSAGMGDARMISSMYLRYSNILNTMYRSEKMDKVTIFQ